MRQRSILTVLAAVLLAACGGSATGAAQDPIPAPMGSIPTPAATASPQASPAAMPPAPSPTAASPQMTDGMAIPGESLEAPEAVAVRAWLEAASAADAAAQWSLLGPRSKDEIGSPEVLATLSTDFAEGSGAWASAPDTVVFRSGVIVVSAEGRRSVVTMSATVMQEGDTERRTVTVPTAAVRDSDDPADARVEPFTNSAAEIVIDGLAERAVTGCVRGISAVLPDTVDRTTAIASVDGGDALRPAVDATSPEGHFAVTLDQPLGAGEHVVTVAAVDTEGDIASAAVRFTVEGTCR